MKRWTLGRVDAALQAVGALLAGEVGEGDSTGLTSDDLEGAHDILVGIRDKLEAGVLCGNCGSTRHRGCCARCGRILNHRSWSDQYCTRRCATQQARDDERSAAVEKRGM